jgi:hypothetical protein
MSIIFEFLKRESDAFEMFKAAYRESFPPGPSPAPDAELNISAPSLAVEADANPATAFLLSVMLEEALFASPEEGRFAEIEWL